MNIEESPEPEMNPATHDMPPPKRSTTKRKTGAAKKLKRKKREAQANLVSHPLQDLMETDGPQAGENVEREAEGPSNENGDKPSDSSSSEERGSVDDATLKLAKLISAVGAFTGRGDHASSSRVPAIDMSKVINRPSTYDGMSGKFHEWKNEIQIYLRVMNFPKEQEAYVVQSYLRGTALTWWLQKAIKLETDELKVPQTWAEFMPYLDERFEHRNPELAARDKLMGLRQGILSLHQYLKEFEGCYAYIPRWEEADKIHRFIFGLKPFYRSKFCVDPATHQWWTSFDSLVAYISSYVSDDVSPPDVLEDATQNLKKAIGLNNPKLTQTTGRGGGGNGHGGGKSRWNKNRQLNAVLGKLNGSGNLTAADRAVLNQVLKGRVSKKFGSVGKSVNYQNANGEAVTRNKHVRSYCHTQNPQLCLGCYQTGHYVKDCTNAVAAGNPPGYKAPARE
jgi:hypothetical protein